MSSVELKRRYRRYPAYRDSGVEWLGKVPEGWETTPLKHIVSFTNGFAFKPSEWVDGGTAIVRIENLNGGGTFNHTLRDLPKRFHAYKGDILFGWSGNRGTSFGPFIWMKAGQHYVNQHIFRVHGYDCDKAWLYWTLKAVTWYIESQAHGIIGMVHITRTDLGAVPLGLPPLPEQSSIADFLDRETAKIDTLIAKKERLLELLDEKRTALISRAVTKGLDPDVPMKDSEVEWLGEVPEGWRTRKAKVLFRYSKELDFPDRTVLSVYRDYGVIEKASRDDNQNKTPENLSTYQLVRPGDLVINKMKAWQGSVGISELAGITSPDYVVYRPQTSDSGRFLHYLLRSAPMATVYLSNSNGIRPGQWRLEPKRFENLELPLPPLPEQQAIAAHLDRETAKLDALKAMVQEAIDRLKEYRTALISAAVTGKIDVREEIVA